MSPDPTRRVLEIRALTKVYPGPVTALDGIDLSIETGMFGLLGPNGAGKTTLMRILAGLLEPTTGSIRLCGEDVVADPMRVRRRLGYLPQELGFYPHLTGRRMLQHLLRLKGVEAEGRSLERLTADLLDRVNLGHAANRKVSTYSGGMRRRLGIAQAVAGDPALVIVDEPTAGLDPEERHRLFRLLAEVAEERIVLLSTHIVDDVAVLCPRLAILRRGRLLASTTPAEARESVEGRIFEARVPHRELEEIHRAHRITRTLIVEGRLRVRIFEPSGRAPLGFDPVPATLEDAYLALVTTDSPGTSGSAPSPGTAPAVWPSPRRPSDRPTPPAAKGAHP